MKKKIQKTKSPAGKGSPEMSPAESAAEIHAFMSEHALDDLTLERDGEKVEICRGLRIGFAHAMPSPRAEDAPVAAPTAAPAAPPVSKYHLIRSPMAGTFYRSPSPSAASYVKEGDRVKADTTVCIIEAMKVMNEIKAEVSGTIVRICLENSAPLAEGDVMFEVDTGAQ